MTEVRLFGPPGTGKTHALLEIMEKELRGGTPPERMAYLTFTVAARREAMSRVQEKFNYPRKRLPYFRTLHSIAYRELELNRSSMVKQEIVEFSQKIGIDITPPYFTEDGAGLDVPMGGLLGDKLLAFDHFRRHNLYDLQRGYASWREDVPWRIVKYFSESYAQWKEREGLYDFTDLLQQAHAPLPVDVVLVDEAQDLSKLQWLALDRFAANAKRVYVAGDDDQAIFTWAGASPDAFLDRRGEVRVLGQSYRLPRRVHDLAAKLIGDVHRRQAKEFSPRAVDGDVQLVMEHDHVAYDRPGSHLILYRNHYLGRDIEERLRQLGLPYAKSDKPAPGAEWGDAIVLWEKLRKGHLLRPEQVIKTLDAMVHVQPLRKRVQQQGEDVLLNMRALHAFGLATEQPWFEALSKIDEAEVEYLRRVIQHHGAKALTDPPRFRMSTIHAAKGAEADHVVLLTDVSRKVRDEMAEAPDDERRVFYVGVTRAKESLTLVGAENPLLR